MSALPNSNSPDSFVVRQKKNYAFLKVFLVIMIIFFIALSGFFVLNKVFTPSQTQNQQGKVPTLPTGIQNLPLTPMLFPDPPNGSTGDFTIEMKKGNNTVVVQWDKSINVSGVTVYDLGTKNTTEDNTIVFAASFVNPSSLQEQIQKQLKQNPKEKPDIKLPPPTTYFPNPYTVGTIPQAYFNLTPESKKPSPETLFQSGKRYSIEVSGIDNAKNPKKAVYVFTN